MNIALDYGGQDEILRAVHRASTAISEGKTTIEGLAQETGRYAGKYPYYQFKDFLDTAGQLYPYPDLIIRTSGEKRLSGFLLWQSAYSEIYWEQDHFPDFTPEKLEEAVAEFSRRSRRFGGN